MSPLVDQRIGGGGGDQAALALAAGGLGVLPARTQLIADFIGFQIRLCQIERSAAQGVDLALHSLVHLIGIGGMQKLGIKFLHLLRGHVGAVEQLFALRFQQRDLGFFALVGLFRNGKANASQL